MDALLNFFTGDLTKVTVFLLLFAAAAIVFEIFYFRKKREHEGPQTAVETTSLTQEPLKVEGRSRKKTMFIIIGVFLIVVLLPASVFVVFQQVNTQKQAQVVTQQPPPTQQTAICDQIDIVRQRQVVDPSTLAVGDFISIVGYCYITDPSQSISKLRFVFTPPSGANNPVEFQAFADQTKNTDQRQYYQATYPNIRLASAGRYNVDIWGVIGSNTQSQTPFSKSFSVTATSASQPTPTQPARQTATQNNQSPTCQTLSAIPLTGPAPLTVSFTGTGSDSDGQVVASEFTFGDGTNETVNKIGTATISHVYQTAGSFTASLRVKDNNGAFSQPSSLCRVTVNVTSGSTATTSASLRAQPTRAATPIPTQVSLPSAGVSLPMVGFVSAGLIILTFGLLLAF